MKLQDRFKKLLSKRNIFGVAILSLFIQVFMLATPTYADFQFRFHKVNVSATPTTGGLVLGGSIGVGYFHGSDVPVTAIPALGYVFTGWTGDCSGNNLVYIIRHIDSTKTCQATFKALLFVGEASVTKNKVYDGNQTATATTGTVHGIRSNDSVSVVTTATYDNKNVGTGKNIYVSYSLTGADASKYITPEGYTLHHGAITALPVAVTANALSKTYGDVDPTLTYSGTLISGDSFTGELARAAGENVGTYAINQGTLSAGSNYIISFTGADFTINAKDIHVSANEISKTYGDADPTFTYVNDELVSGDTFSGELARLPGENVGEYEITLGTLALSSNYNLLFEGSFLTIDKFEITVTATAQSKVYGSADPIFTYALSSGLKFTDTFTGALARVTGENVGQYAIDQGTLVLNANYDLSFVGEKLTITAMPMTVAINAQSKVYGTSDPINSYRITSGFLVKGDVLNSVFNRVAGENVGTYVITGVLTNPNYIITTVPSNLAITKASITITANDQSKLVGAADPIFTYTITSGSLVGTDAATGSLTRVEGETAGTYTIGQGTLGLSDNYDLTFIGGTLTVSTAPEVRGATTTKPTDEDNGIVLGEETSKTTDEDQNNFFNGTFLGIHYWMWLLLLLAGIIAAWWIIAKKRDNEE